MSSQDQFATGEIQEKPVPRYKLIEKRIRHLIDSGEFSTGSRLPGVRELALRFDTNVFTIHQALGPLEREGLIECRRKLGTVVTKGSPRLACVGIYFSSNFIYDDDMSFYRRLCDCLISRLETMGWGHQLWTETLRPGDNRVPGKLIETVQQAVRKGQIQALICPMINSPAFDIFHLLPIPSAFITSGKVSNKVCYNYDSLARAGLEALKEQGCRSVGLITNMYRHPDDDTGNDYGKFHRSFTEAATGTGLEIRSEWIKCPPDGVIVQAQPRFGYEQFAELWSQSERPDGLLVYPDNTAKGVVTAVLERRIDVPRELKLALHRNDGVDFLCPLPATWLCSNVTDTADSLISLIRDQVAGLNIIPRHLIFRREENR